MIRFLRSLISSAAAAALLAGCRAPTPKTPANYSDVSSRQKPEMVTVKNTAPAGLLDASSSLFTLGPGDKVDIELLGRPESRTTATVGADGKIYYSLLPGLDVNGMTLARARDAVEKAFAKYLTQPPTVSLTLREVASKHVWVVGRLQKPGIYPLNGQMTLLEALAEAGGTARSTSLITTEELADLRHAFVLRAGQHLPVDFRRLLKEGDLSQNVLLQPDDFIFVPSSLTQEVYILGAVRTPRAISYREGMSLLTAVSGSEGAVKYNFLSRYDNPFTKDAYLSHVAVVRGSLAEPQVAVVDLGAIMKGRAADVPLEPGDIVYVPNSPFRFLKSYVNLIVNTFVGTVAANEGIRAGGGDVGIGVSVPVGGR